MNDAVRATQTNHRGYARFGYAAIILVFGGFGGWAAVAPLDRAAIARGQIAVESSHKVVQHLEGGIIREILVKETQMVQEGDVLFRLQPTEAQANTDLLRKQIDAAFARQARTLAELSGAKSIAFPDALLARQSIPETAMAMADQERQFAESRRALDNQIGILSSQIEQKRQDAVGRERQKTSLSAQLASYTQEMNSVFPLVAKGYYPRNKYLALERDRARIEGDLGVVESDLARFAKAVEENEILIRQAKQKVEETASQQLNDARAKLSDLREKLLIAEDVLRRVDIRAQRAGVVIGLQVHTVGAVVKPGETLAEIVPVGDGLDVMAHVSPADIESITIGQKAEVRFSNFSSRRTPIIQGYVASVSADSMKDETTKQPYYSARIAVDYQSIAPELAQHIVPGMQADVLISTGERTMLEFLVDPLLNSLAKTFREK
jgi:HlyD family type I secretion membrane fusion protein